MKANELMIGDWVLYGEKPVKILQLSEGKDYKEIHPVPLAPEILKKNGWKRYEDCGDDFHGDNCVFLRQVDGDYGVCLDNKLTISGRFRYVHELQHALKFCGIEKEITL